MDETLIVKTDAKPTYFNKEAVVGSLAGFITGGLIDVPVALVTGIPGLGLALGTLTGGTVGAATGKSHMRHELEHGHEVKAPSRLNKDAAIGGMLGLIAGAIATVGAAVGGGFLTLAAAGANASPTLTVVGSALTLASMALSPFVGAAAGAFIGGGMGKADMAKEYQEATVQLAVSQQIERGQALSLAQEAGKGKSFAERVAQERNAEAPQLAR